jgi:hypothetical protein
MNLIKLLNGNQSRDSWNSWPQSDLRRGIALRQRLVYLSENIENGCQ